MSRKYYSYAGVHYETLEIEINRLLLNLKYPGNENPVFNYLGVYRVYKDAEGKYTITKNLDNVLLSKSPDEISLGDLEFTIVKDLIKNPWAIAPPIFTYEVLQTEQCIGFLNKQIRISNDEEDIIYFQRIKDILYNNLFDLGNQPDSIYNSNGALYYTKSFKPNKWNYVQEIKNKIITKEGYENWGRYIESYLLFPASLDKVNEEFTRFDYEVELLGKLFNIDIP